MNTNKLWTKDFTIITLGSVISMLGNSLAGFAVSLFVLDYTNKPALYAVYMFLYTLPQIAAPLIAGPLMDHFSRRRTIYLLDFLSSLLYLLMGCAIYINFFNFGLLAIMTLIIGTINSAYQVAFESFYPMLISEGYYSKAYSVSSTLDTLSTVMIPVSTFLYKSFGIFPLLLANAASFLVAALFEVQISDVEAKKGNLSKESYNIRAYLTDSKEGFQYLLSERGLLRIAIFFTFLAFSGCASSVITLPWFRETYHDGEYIYMSVWVFMVIGRVLGGVIHYNKKMPASKKYIIAFVVYIISNTLEGCYLYTPLSVMRVCCFFIGILGTTSYNIRISATQTYIPDEMKGRYNGAFFTMNTGGALIGELLAGLAITYIPMRTSISLFMGVTVIAAFVIIGGGKQQIEPIYNRNT